MEEIFLLLVGVKMIKELTPAQVLFKFSKTDISKGLKGNAQDYIPNMDNVYDYIGQSLNINREGFNLFIIDNFSKEKLGEITRVIEKNLQMKGKPEDILYVSYTNEREPKVIKLPGGQGKVFVDTVEKIKDAYKTIILDFYNLSLNNEKEDIIDELKEKRNDFMEELTILSEKSGFNVKATMGGFAFIPLKDGDTAMTEEEYDELRDDDKEDISNKASILKEEAEKILDKIKKLEIDAKEKLTEILKETLSEGISDIKNEGCRKCSESTIAVEYINKLCSYVEKNVVENYSINYENDSDEIDKILSQYSINLLVDNSKNKYPSVIYEENPTVQNLVGDIEYEVDKGAYVTSMKMIKAGDILKANEGCLILNANTIATTPGAYMQLKKVMSTGKISYDYNKAYLDILTINTLRPEAIDVDIKIILIGDYTMYNLFLSYDEEFSKLFKLTAEYDPVLESSASTNVKLVKYIIKLIHDNHLLAIEEDALTEMVKILFRKAESKKKFIIDDLEIDKMLFRANLNALNEGRNSICEKNVMDIYEEKSIAYKNVFDFYKSKKIYIDVTSKIVGSINGLAVIDTGMDKFGKPIRITCVCSKGTGKVNDFQKDNKLSGPIHEKSICILKSLLDSVIGSYSDLPVDFNISFEQMYGKIEGDSASIAEIVCMISALSKIGIKQNIAVTGSVNQFGEVQPIGGVNEKIEGFYTVCKKLDKVDGKAVLIPYTNADELILCREVEDSIKKNKFKIYTMQNVKDAINLLIGGRNMPYDKIMDKIKYQLKLYKSSK